MFLGPTLCQLIIYSLFIFFWQNQALFVPSSWKLHNPPDPTQQQRYQRVNHTLKLLWQYQVLLLLLLLTVIVSRPCVTDPFCSLYSHLQAKSLYISWAVSYFFWSRYWDLGWFWSCCYFFCNFDKVNILLLQVFFSFSKGKAKVSVHCSVCTKKLINVKVRK